MKDSYFSQKQQSEVKNVLIDLMSTFASRDVKGPILSKLKLPGFSFDNRGLGDM